MFHDNIIQHNRSSFSSMEILVRKKNRDWRFFVDYKALDEMIVKDTYPIPTVEEIFDELHRTRFFSKIDLKLGFHQIRLIEDSIPKSAFHTHDLHYGFRFMLFELCNMPSTF